MRQADRHRHPFKGDGVTASVSAALRPKTSWTRRRSTGDLTVPALAIWPAATTLAVVAVETAGPWIHAAAVGARFEDPADEMAGMDVFMQYKFMTSVGNGHERCM